MMSHVASMADPAASDPTHHPPRSTHHAAPTTDTTDTKLLHDQLTAQWQTFGAEEKALGKDAEAKALKKVLLKAFRGSFASTDKAGQIETQLVTQITEINSPVVLRFAAIFAAKSLCATKSTGLAVTACVNIGNVFHQCWEAFAGKGMGKGLPQSFIDMGMSALADASSMTVPFLGDGATAFDAIEGAAECQQFLDNVRTRVRILASIARAQEGAAVGDAVGFADGFGWVARLMNAPPVPAVTPLALRSYLEIAGHRLQAEYPAFFASVLKAATTQLVAAVTVANPDTEPQKAAAREALALKDFLAGVYAGGAACPVTGEAILPTISGPAHDLGQFPLPCRA